MCGTEGCRVRVSMKNSSPSSATKVISTCAILSLAVHRGPSSFTIDTHKLSRPLYLSYDLDILKQKINLSFLTFTFRQGASGFRPQSMGKLDTQLVAMNAGGFRSFDEIHRSWVKNLRIYLRRNGPRPVAAESPQRRHILDTVSAVCNKSDQG